MSIDKKFPTQGINSSDKSEKLENELEVVKEGKERFFMIGNKKIKAFGITKLKNNQGFVVRLGCEDGNCLVHKEFYVNNENNLGSALEEAAKFRDKKIQDLMLDCHVNREGIILKNSKTRITGVHWRNKKKAYVATWYNDWEGDKTIKKTQFSEKKWGLKNAFYLAWASRLEKRRIKSIEEAHDIVENKSLENHEEVWEKEKKRVEKL